MSEAKNILPNVKKRTFRNDPIAVQEYTLSNGFKLFFSVNHDEPQVYTEIAVRAGSKHDPADTTGLAHYFEHMMFKGTDKLGSLDWAKEKIVLDKIEDLFEQHRAEKNPEQKRILYAEIDRLSFEAAKLAAANEYDKLVSAIGAKNTNAYTWVEQTVYVNDIPSNELERWFKLESERFRRPVLRLFHTELETVFEEYNINQDKDFRKTLKTMQAILTPTHPYGTQTTLGRGEDLKNPSQKNIYRFFDQYYIPNNMAMVLCGDFDPDQALQLAQKYFGGFMPKKKPVFRFTPQPELASRIHKDVLGTESPWVEIAWRVDGAKSNDAMLAPIVSGILYNGAVGLIDEYIMQEQRLLEAYAFPRTYEDYGSFYCYGKPREGQTHADVERILMAEVDRLRRGEFHDWLPQAVIKNMKLSEARQFEKNEGRAGALTSAYVLGLDWGEFTKRWKKWETITKADIVEFANRVLRDNNYGVVYKHAAPDPDVMKVEKPPITPVELNRVDASGFAKDFLSTTAPEIAPQFVNFKQLIKTSRINNGVRLRAVPDKKRPVFRLDFCFDMGKSADKRLNLLESYLGFLGTSKYSAMEVQQAFFRLGISFSITSQDEKFYISLFGLPESFAPAVNLLEHILADAQPEAEALKNLVDDILQRRINDKQDKRTVMFKGMLNFARFGKTNTFTNRYKKKELEAIQPAELIDLLRSLTGFEHEVYYNGPNPLSQVRAVLKSEHHTPEVLQKPLVNMEFKEQKTERNKVYFLDFPMVQTDLLLYSKGTSKFNLAEYLFAQWYNQYFGYGLSSIVYQDIREARALAYSAYAYAATPGKKKRAHFVQAYVGTQPDKLQEAVNAFQEILENMPVSVPQIEHARSSVLKQIASERISPSELYWTWRATKDKGYEMDMRELVYNHLQAAKPEDLIQYQAQFIKSKKYTWLVMGERHRIDFKFLRSIGKVEELTLEDVFGY